ncbi:hypothetical protein LCGC14_1923580 [marine sediment metagenome]|uniref:Uncharacterized protein n=1 Tax=marine sediment metagenome TaxID=412755 RepID=A0A0F9IMU8_9ZZZZ|nr:hypothetical protein [Porticoccus sp.]
MGLSQFYRIAAVGGAPAFLPSDIAGLQLWLDANDSATLFQDAAKTTAAGNGDVVGAWADKSGQGNDATQATTSKKPTRQDGIIGGLPVVRGDAGDDYLATNTGALTAETIFIVAKHAVNNALGIMVDSTGAGDTRIVYSPIVNRVIYSYDFVNAIVSSGFTETDPIIITAKHDGVTTLSLSVNSDTPVTASRAVDSHTYLHLLSRSSTSMLNGDIAELLIYDSELSDGNITLVENYLSNKWGIALS